MKKSKGGLPPHWQHEQSLIEAVLEKQPAFLSKVSLTPKTFVAFLEMGISTETQLPLSPSRLSDDAVEVMESLIYNYRNSEIGLHDSVSIERTNQPLTLTMQRWDPTDVFWKDRVPTEKWEALLGVQYVNGIRVPVTAKLKKKPHFLVGGGSGSGKSVMTDSILSSLMEGSSPEDLAVHLIDINGKHFTGWEGLPHVMSLSRSLEQAYQVLNYVSSLMVGPEDAYETIHIVAIDELSMLTDPEKANPDTVKKFVAVLRQISRMGRGYGVHLLLATQNPKVDVIPTSIRSNIGNTMAGMCSNGHQSAAIVGPSREMSGASIRNTGVFTDGDKKFFSYFLSPKNGSLQKQMDLLVDKWPKPSWSEPSQAKVEEPPERHEQQQMEIIMPVDNGPGNQSQGSPVDNELIIPDQPVESTHSEAHEPIQSGLQLDGSLLDLGLDNEPLFETKKDKEARQVEEWAKMVFEELGDQWDDWWIPSKSKYVHKKAQIVKDMMFGEGNWQPNSTSAGPAKRVGLRVQEMVSGQMEQVVS